MTAADFLRFVIIVSLGVLAFVTFLVAGTILGLMWLDSWSCGTCTRYPAGLYILGLLGILMIVSISMEASEAPATWGPWILEEPGHSYCRGDQLRRLPHRPEFALVVLGAPEAPLTPTLSPRREGSARTTRSGCSSVLSPLGERDRVRGSSTPPAYFIVGITNSAPSLTPPGQREVTVLVLV